MNAGCLIAHSFTQQEFPEVLLCVDRNVLFVVSVLRELPV